MAKAMGVSRASLYYRAKQPDKDWAMKVRIEEALRRHPSYGSRRIADELGMERRRVRRVMRLFGIKPYRRHGKRYRRSKAQRTFPNLLLDVMPLYPNHVWATDFTELAFRGKKVYVSTVLDLFTRRLMGVQVAVRKGASLTVQTLANALLHHPKPAIFHSDNGRDRGFAVKARMSVGERVPGIVLRQVQSRFRGSEPVQDAGRARGRDLSHHVGLQPCAHPFRA
jgi:putative transposase